MLKFWMQLGGGIFYLLNKIFFNFKERTSGETSRLWRIWAWMVYIIGLPFWLVILGNERNWMVFFVETGGVPAMLFGLLTAISKEYEEPTSESKKLERIFDLVARWAVVVGIVVSFYRVGLMTTLTQWAELGVVVGFLVGTYRLAKDRLDGYLWFLLMNSSAGWLMYLQEYKWLFWQQMVSLVFVLDAYFVKKRRMRPDGNAGISITSPSTTKSAQV